MFKKFKIINHDIELDENKIYVKRGNKIVILTPQDILDVQHNITCDEMLRQIKLCGGDFTNTIKNYFEKEY